MKYRLDEVANIIRSKNSGPYELTLDILFKSQELYEKIVAKKIFNEDLICRLYQIEPEKIINIVNFTPAHAIKITLVRPRASGDPGERDVYGAQQHAPLLDLTFEL